MHILGRNPDQTILVVTLLADLGNHRFFAKFIPNTNLQLPPLLLRAKNCLTPLVPTRLSPAQLSEEPINAHTLGKLRMYHAYNTTSLQKKKKKKINWMPPKTSLFPRENEISHSAPILQNENKAPNKFSFFCLYST